MARVSASGEAVKYGGTLGDVAVGPIYCFGDDDATNAWGVAPDGKNARPNSLAVGSGGITVAGGTVTVGTDQAANVNLTLSAAAGQTRHLRYQTAGVNRWHMHATNTAEAGADAGSNLEFEAYTDAGVVIDHPITIVRAAGGAITTVRPLICTGLPAFVAGSHYLVVDGTGHVQVSAVGPAS